MSGKHFLADSPNAALDKTIVSKYLNLPIPSGLIQVTYIWIDGTGERVRCKDRTLDFIPSKPGDLPQWNYDGSSTLQATGENSDIFLYPRAIYKDPFKGGNNILVMCDTYKHDYEPTESNHRKKCEEAYQLCKAEIPWFGIEQEYFLLDFNNRPFGWPNADCAPVPAANYCAVGANYVFVRDLVEAHYRCCLYAGITISGTNAEVMPAQWEFQVGPCVGTKAADDLWVARFILHRLAEEFGVIVSFHPKPIPNWNGSGAHTNFSTKKMREDNGIVEIEKAISKLSRCHMKHIKVYDPHGGLDNAQRLTGKFETSSIHDFSSGVANRGCSIRIPRNVAELKKGYLEDRRPSSNCDPYAVVDVILRTCCLDE